MTYSKIVIFLLALALAVQNTCPLKLSAKTGFVSPRMHHCCCAKKTPERSKAADSTPAGLFRPGPAFVFIGQGMDLPGPMQVSQGGYTACPYGHYQNIALNPPEKPPRLS